MAKTLTEMAVEITTAQASHASMSAEEAEEFLRKTFEALRQIKKAEEAEAPEEKQIQPGLRERETGFVDPQKSIQRNKVVCLECGREFKVLTNRHLKEHGLDAKTYRSKYGFSARQPLSAKTLSAKRRKVAKDLGLGEKLQKGRKAKAKKAAAKKS